MSELMSLDSIIKFLSNTNFLRGFDLSALESLAKQLSVKLLDGGDVLVSQGEVGDCLYFLAHGRLRVFVNADTSEKRVVGEIGSGETIGEIAVLTNEPRVATVIAIRSCILLQLSKKSFEKLAVDQPQLALEIAKRCIVRLAEHQKAFNKNPVQKLKTIALIPMTGDPRLQGMLQKLINELKNFGSVLNLTEEFIKSILHIDLSNEESFERNYTQLISWLNDQEHNYDFIVYQANFINDRWAKLCKQQADAIFLMGFSRDDSFLNNSDKELFFPNKLIRSRIHLILLHENKNTLPSGTIRWLKYLNTEDYQHMVFDDKAHIKRLARIISGNSIGLVLGGGGARGFAHVGLIQALEEKNIPIDFVAGTSMGAIIASLYAFGFDAKHLKEAAAYFAKQVYRLDLTFPYVSLTTGACINRFLNEKFGKTQCIEDLWLRNFYVSTNLSKNNTMVHQNGLLWRAVRASIALPAVYPPVIENDNVLVDGALMNNLPVDLMRELCNPGKVIASTIISTKNRFGFSHDEDKLPSLWQILRNKFSASAKDKRMSYIGDIVMSAIVMHGAEHQIAMEKSADQCIYHDMTDFSLTDFKAFDKIIAAGYKHTMEQLKNCDNFNFG
jgi:predicted acylesterase/phospholipase RssA/CRP-like cAMP-binding protein